MATIEGRLKRKTVLENLHRLRSIVHVIDMHQLTKDPEQVLSPTLMPTTAKSREMTRFELVRYLDYCAEMLSISSKMAALHVQYVNDPVIARCRERHRGACIGPGEPDLAEDRDPGYIRDDPAADGGGVTATR